jgi:hypothetical protein
MQPTAIRERSIGTYDFGEGDTYPLLLDPLPLPPVMPVKLLLVVEEFIVFTSAWRAHHPHTTAASASLLLIGWGGTHVSTSHVTICFFK